jgi:hypothetical protein
VVNAAAVEPGTFRIAFVGSGSRSSESPARVVALPVPVLVPLIFDRFVSARGHELSLIILPRFLLRSERVIPFVERIENSQDRTTDDFLSLSTALLGQTADWEVGEADLKSRRNAWLQRMISPG